MNRRNAPRQVLIPLPGHLKPSRPNHVPKVRLAREPLDALHQVLVAVPVSRDELSDQGDGAEAPLLVHGVEERDAVGLGEFEAGEDAAGLEHAVRLLEGGGHIGEVADAKGHGVQVEGVVFDGGGDLLRVGFEEGEAGLVRGREREGAVAADLEHGWVDVGDCDVDVGVAVVGVRVLEHSEGNVACTASHVEDLL